MSQTNRNKNRSNNDKQRHDVVGDIGSSDKPIVHPSRRPWDKISCIRRPTNKMNGNERNSQSVIDDTTATNYNTSNVHHAFVESENNDGGVNDDGDYNDNIPFIEIDHIKYYSDRFYLNHTIYNDEFNDDNNNMSSRNTSNCFCGARNAPPLFNIRRLIETRINDIQAALIGTFSFDIEYMIQTFPQLFSPTAAIPTLVLHGKKGWTMEQYERELDLKNNVEIKNVDDEPESEPSTSTPLSKKIKHANAGCDNYTCHKTLIQNNHDNTNILHSPVSNDGSECFSSQILYESPSYHFTNNDESSIMTQEFYKSPQPMTKNSVTHSSGPRDSIQCSNHSQTIKHSLEKNIQVNIASTQGNVRRLPPTVHFSEVQPVWVIPSSSRTSTSVGSSVSTSKTESKVGVRNDSTKPTPIQNEKENFASGSIDDDIGSQSAKRHSKNNTSIYRQGVHHPKYMILFEKNGSVIVIVSTANMTRPMTTDATWCQQFPPTVATTTGRLPRMNKDFSLHHKDDFGRTLSQFLYCSSAAIKSQQMTINQFVQTYLHWKSITEMNRRFDYSQAQVHLIPTIPGDYEGAEHHIVQSNKNNKTSITTNKTKKDESFLSRSSTTKDKRNNIPSINHNLFGRQRVESILETLSSGPNPTMLSRGGILDEHNDRLIIQPTSFGGEWNVANMSSVVRSYMNSNSTSISSSMKTNNNNEKNNRSSNDDQIQVERIDIVWPTERFVQSCITRCERLIGTTTTMDQNENEMLNENGTRTKLQSKLLLPRQGIENNISSNTNTGKEKVDMVKLDKEQEGYLFLSSDTFNRIDVLCLSQMVQYEPSYPYQQLPHIVPHMKSICRLFNGNDYRLRKEYNIQCKAEEYFSWFLLTSACLSRGAQGEDTIGRLPTSASVSYSNFELGVLFTSRLPKDGISTSTCSSGGKSSRRLYCWKPSICTCTNATRRRRTTTTTQQRTIISRNVNDCNKSTLTTRTIHLPVPYCLRPAHYQEDIDECDFCETPYFHEILPGTACVGHMKLTPYGCSVAKEYDIAGL